MNEMLLELPRELKELFERIIKVSILGEDDAIEKVVASHCAKYHITEEELELESTPVLTKYLNAVEFINGVLILATFNQIGENAGEEATLKYLEKIGITKDDIINRQKELNERYNANV